MTRRRFDTLVEHGISIAGFIDIDSDRIGQRSLGVPVVGPDRLPDPGDSFILSGVGVRGAREEIRTTLLASGRREGRGGGAAAPPAAAVLARGEFLSPQCPGCMGILVPVCRFHSIQ